MFLFNGNKKKFKEFIIQLLKKGWIEEYEEKEILKHSLKLKLTPEQCSKIRSEVLQERAKPLLNIIANTKMYGYEQEEKLTRLAADHRVDAVFGEEFKVYRQNWLATMPKHKISNNEIFKEQKIIHSSVIQQKYNFHENIAKLELNISANIEYSDAQDNYTKREITINALCPSLFDNDYYLKAYCHEKNEERNFKLERIRKYIDRESGEIITDLNKYFNDIFENSPLGIVSKVLMENQNEITILEYIARADGKFIKQEREIICEYLINKYTLNIDSELLGKGIRNVDCNVNDYRKAVKALKYLESELLHQLLLYIVKIVNTKKTIDPIVKGALELLKKETKIELPIIKT